MFFLCCILVSSVLTRNAKSGDISLLHSCNGGHMTFCVDSHLVEASGVCFVSGVNILIRLGSNAIQLFQQLIGEVIGRKPLAVFLRLVVRQVNLPVTDLFQSSVQNHVLIVLIAGLGRALLDHVDVLRSISRSKIDIRSGVNDLPLHVVGSRDSSSDLSIRLELGVVRQVGNLNRNDNIYGLVLSNLLFSAVDLNFVDGIGLAASRNDIIDSLLQIRNTGFGSIIALDLLSKSLKSSKFCQFGSIICHFEFPPCMFKDVDLLAAKHFVQHLCDFIVSRNRRFINAATAVVYQIAGFILDEVTLCFTIRDNSQFLSDICCWIRLGIILRCFERAPDFGRIHTESILTLDRQRELHLGICIFSIVNCHLSFPPLSQA
nr:MAG TPA: hypothetical protein [Bacteriophage sp.]